MKIDLYKARKVDDGRTFYIGAGKLYDYLSELRTDFFNFDIQRRIVVNSYLDSIGDTVRNNIPFPAITLTTQTAIEDDVSSIPMFRNARKVKNEIMVVLVGTFMSLPISILISFKSLP